MQPGTESFRVAPDSESPLAPRFLFYGVYSDAGVRISKAPIDAEEPWVSKINLDDIPPPVSVASLLHILKMKEGLKTFSFPQLFAQDSMRPLTDNPIFTEDGHWLGSSAEEHLMFKFAIRPPFAEGSKYKIQNFKTRHHFLGIQNASSKNVEIYSAGHGVARLECTNFTLKIQDDDLVAFRAVHSGLWIAPNCGTSETEQGASIIPLTPYKDCYYFYISEDDPVSPTKLFYDPGITNSSRYPLQLKAADKADARQIWCLFKLPIMIQV
jgi:hypothetical protein